MPAITPEMREVMEETAEDFRRRGMVPELPPAEGWRWEPRQPGEMTPEYLGRVLDFCGLPGLGRRAREGHFDDFHAPAEHADGLELIRLVAELRVATRSAAAARAANAAQLADDCALIERAVKCGEFDATKAESDRWAASKDGQATMAELANSAVTQEGLAKLRAAFSGKVKRNDPCPCGSGKKWKKCHGR